MNFLYMVVCQVQLCIGMTIAGNVDKTEVICLDSTDNCQVVSVRWIRADTSKRT